jgi:hypothetical protein
MNKFDSFITVSLCGTDHQRTIGLRGLRIICGSGEIEVLDGFWQLDPPEYNVKIRTWTDNLDDLVVKIAKFCEAYQHYASQESIFITFKDKDRHEARVVYTGEWGDLILEVSRVEYLIKYFDDQHVIASFEAQADRYDGRDEYPNH